MKQAKKKQVLKLLTIGAVIAGISIATLSHTAGAQEIYTETSVSTETRNYIEAYISELNYDELVRVDIFLKLHKDNFIKGSKHGQIVHYLAERVEFTLNLRRQEDVDVPYYPEQ